MSSRILIVEDDPDFAASLELALSLVNLSVVLAGSAEEAHEIFAAGAEDINAGFFDIKLPQEDGITCFENIRIGNPAFVGIVMTGFRDEKLLQRARDAGAAEILLKPFKMAYFMDLAKKYAG